MSTASLMSSDGWSSRLAIGALWLGALGTAGAGKSLLPALPIAAVAAALAGYCSRELRALESPTAGRGVGRFARTWCRLLSLLGALAGAARALGGTLDALSGGRARRWLFGELPAPPASEPWPDPLAVAALAVLCIMFMCGLENHSTFTALLITSVVSGVVFFVVVGSLAANVSNWQEQSFHPNGWNGLILSAASCSYAFPAVLPVTGTALRRLTCVGLLLLPLACMMAITAAFNFLVPYREYSESAVPLVQVFETHPPGWASPAMASFTVVGLALAMTEVLPQAVGLLVTMAGPNWKVLTRVLTYESSTTGSQVLAVFSAGSLSAILAFACPMTHLVKLTGAGQMLVWILEAGTLLHLRCQPENVVEEPTDVRYKRLAGAQQRPPVVRASRGARLAAGLWFLPRSVRHQGPPDPHKTWKGGEDRECLLLDEYAATRPEIAESDHSEVSEHGNTSSEGESSTDIDAVVKEYKDRITVVSSTPESPGDLLGVPCAASGKRGTAGAIIIVGASFLFSLGVAVSQPNVVYIAIPVLVGGILLNWWQPVRSPAVGVMCCSTCCLLCCVLAAPLLADAWPALVMFTAAGLVMYARRSTLCGAVPKRRSRATPLLGTRPSRLTHLDTVYIAR